MLLHYAGEAVNDILNTSDDTEAEEGQDLLEKNDDSDHENTFQLEVQTDNGKVQKQPRFKVKIGGTWIVRAAKSVVNILDEANQPTVDVTSTKVCPHQVHPDQGNGRWAGHSRKRPCWRIQRHHFYSSLIRHGYRSNNHQ